VNAWIASFDVQHDVGGLIRLMGGRQAFASKLDELFETIPDTSKRVFLNQFPDMTGLVGMYAQGNEPAFHIPYLYVFAGEPWKTQFRIRQLLDTQFSDLPDGLPGDEDGGAESSWYVFSALGFYPVCPGLPIYEIGTPLFPKSQIALGGGRVFTVVTSGVSGSNKYIGSATLNGKPLERAWFTHDEVEKGGILVLQMQSAPNRNWGSRVQDLPPSDLEESVQSAKRANSDKR
jgi:predicted alpha-1,2-mannosidase